VAQPIDRGLRQQAVVGECLVPLLEVEIAGHDGGGLLVALGDEIVQILICWRSQGLQTEVIDLCGDPHNAEHF
jgi:hypothetical protein